MEYYETVDDISSPFDLEDIDSYQKVRNYKFLGDMQYEDYIPAIKQQIKDLKTLGIYTYINYIDMFEQNYRASVAAAEYGEEEIFVSLKHEFLSSLFNIFEDMVGVYLTNDVDIYMPDGYNGIKEIYDNFIVTSPAESFVKLYLADILRDVTDDTTLKAVFDDAVANMQISEITNDKIFEYYPCKKVLQCMQGGIIMGNIYNSLLNPVLENKVDYSFIYYELTSGKI